MAKATLPSWPVPPGAMKLSLRYSRTVAPGAAWPATNSRPPSSASTLAILTAGRGAGGGGFAPAAGDGAGGGAAATDVAGGPDGSAGSAPAVARGGDGSGADRTTVGRSGEVSVTSGFVVRSSLMTTVTLSRACART